MARLLCLLWRSCYEIYGGKVFDLLNGRKKLDVREDGRKRVQVGAAWPAVGALLPALCMSDCSKMGASGCRWLLLPVGANKAGRLIARSAYVCGQPGCAFRPVSVQVGALPTCRLYVCAACRWWGCVRWGWAASRCCSSCATTLPRHAVRAVQGRTTSLRGETSPCCWSCRCCCCCSSSSAWLLLPLPWGC